MKPHPRIRKTIKWGGAVVTVLLVVVWIGSRWLGADWHGMGSGYAMIVDGSLIVARGESTDLTGLRVLHVRGIKHRSLFAPFYLGQSAPRWSIWVPLWTPVAILILPTVAAWRFDALARRRERAARLNLCPKCNYDRAGIAAGAACPECGHTAVR
jgi:hypothetical protein